MMISHIYACACGAETEVEAGALSLGRVIECPACQVISAHVYPHGGGRAWITVDPKEAAFHRLVSKEEL